MTAGAEAKKILEARARAALHNLFGRVQEQTFLGEPKTVMMEGRPTPMDAKPTPHLLIAPFQDDSHTPQVQALKMAAVLQKLLGDDIVVATASPSARKGQAGVGAQEVVYVAIDKQRLLKHAGAVAALEQTTADALREQSERLLPERAIATLAKSISQRAGGGFAAAAGSARTAPTSRRWAVDRPPTTPRGR